MPLIARSAIGDKLIVGRLDIEGIVRRFQNGPDLRREANRLTFGIAQVEEPEPPVGYPAFRILLAAKHPVILLQFIEHMLLELPLEVLTFLEQLLEFCLLRFRATVGMHCLPVKIGAVDLVSHRLMGIQCDAPRWHQWFAQHVGSTGQLRLPDHLALAKHEHDL